MTPCSSPWPASVRCGLFTVQVPDNNVNGSLPPASPFPPFVPGLGAQRTRGCSFRWGRGLLPWEGHRESLSENPSNGSRLRKGQSDASGSQPAAASHSRAHKPGRVRASEQMVDPALCHPGPPRRPAEALQLSPSLDKEVNSLSSLTSLSPGSGQIMGVSAFPQRLFSAPRQQPLAQKQVNPDCTRHGVSVLLGSARGRCRPGLLRMTTALWGGSEAKGGEGGLTNVSSASFTSNFWNLLCASHLLVIHCSRAN